MIRLIVLLFTVTAYSLCCGAGYAQISNSPLVIHNSGHSNTVNVLQVSPNGRWLASASSDSTVKLWDMASGRLLRTLIGHTKKVSSVGITADGTQVVSLSEDATIKVWDAESGKLIRTITGLLDKNDFVQNAMTLSSDGRSVFSHSFKAIRRIDIGSGATQKRYPEQSTFASWLDFGVSADDRYIAAAHSGAVNASLKNSGIGSQVKLLDAASGRVLRVLGTYSERESVSSIAFSPNGRMVAAGGPEGFAKVWDVASGRLLFTLPHSEDKNRKFVNQVGFTADSKQVVTAGGPDGIKLWDATSGQMMRAFNEKRHAWAQAFTFDRSGRILISASGDAMSVTDVTTGAKLSMSFGLPDTSGVGYVPLPGGRWAEISSHSMAVWDAVSGQLIQYRDEKGLGSINAPERFWSEDQGGTVTVAMHGADDEQLVAKIRNASSGVLLREIAWGAPPKGKACSTCSPYSLENITMSPNGRWLAATLYGDDRSIVKIWDTSDGRQVASIATGAGTRLSSDSLPTRAANRMNFTPDSRGLVIGSFDAQIKQWIKVWDIETVKLRSAFRLEEKAGVGEAHNYQFALSPDGRTIATQYLLYGHGGDLDGTSAIATFDLTSGRMLHTFLADKISSNANLIQYSPDGRLIFVGNYNSNLVDVWEAETGRLLHRLEDNPGSPWSIAFSSDGHRFIVGNMNGTSSAWDLRTFQRLTVSIHAGSGEWVTITPEGFFTASEHGAELLHVVRGFETIGIDQVYQSLYRPDLVREKLSGDLRGLVRDAAGKIDLAKVLSTGSAPEVHLNLPGGGSALATDQTVAEAEIVDRGGGIGRIEWRVNGVTAGVDKPVPTTANQQLRLTRTLALDPGENSIDVVAYNGANLIASVPAHASLTVQAVPPPATAPGSATTPPPVAAAPRLFVLAAGSDNYADKRFRLQYSVADAKAMAQSLADTGKEVYGGVEVRTMSDADVVVQKLDRMFEQLSKTVLPSDVFVLYLAGHGKTVDGRYYFVPQDFAADEKLTDATLDAAVKAQGISQEQWQRWFAEIPARRSLILFDTCESGTLTGVADDTKTLEQAAANDRMAQATGRSIITASSGSTEAFEGYHGHGLFTYNLLDALDKGDGDGNGTIEVSELAAFVYAQVTAISERVFRQRQEPQMKITLNYPLAKRADVLHEGGTPVAQAKPSYQLAQAAALQVKPANGATVVRSLSPKTPVTVLKSENGWSLVATNGEPIGYVATRDLAPVQ